MIIRILGEGQWRFDESHMNDLNACDEAIETALEDQDQEKLTAALKSMIEEIRTLGEQLPNESLEDSDLIMPDVDATLTEVAALLEDSPEGMIPGR